MGNNIIKHMYQIFPTEEDSMMSTYTEIQEPCGSSISVVKAPSSLFRLR